MGEVEKKEGKSFELPSLQATQHLAASVPRVSFNRSSRFLLSGPWVLEGLINKNSKNMDGFSRALVRPVAAMVDPRFVPWGCPWGCWRGHGTSPRLHAGLFFEVMVSSTSGRRGSGATTGIPRVVSTNKQTNNILPDHSTNNEMNVVPPQTTFDPAMPRCIMFFVDGRLQSIKFEERAYENGSFVDCQGCTQAGCRNDAQSTRYKRR